jgi:hypothetical protein
MTKIFDIQILGTKFRAPTGVGRAMGYDCRVSHPAVAGFGTPTYEILDMMLVA